MKRALFVAYAFPPVGGAGVQRVVKFIKYLHPNGWSADAVSVLNPSVPLIDESLVKELPSDCTVYRSKTYEPSYAMKATVKNSGNGKKTLRSRFTGIVKIIANNILLPDAQILWWPHTYLLLSKLFKEKKHDVVFVSGPPFSTFILTVFLAKKYNIPVVIDFRDEWSFSRDNWENATKTVCAKFIDSFMERYVVKNATAITVASPYYKTSLEKHYPFAVQKIHTITNGYDPDDFAGVDFSKSNRSASEYFTIVYTGTIWRATSMEPFLNGVRKLAETAPDTIAKIKLRIIGRIVAEESHTIEMLRNFIAVETVDYLPHEKIFPEIASADLLLLTLSDLPGSDKIIPGKTFEYLAAQIPILAIIPKGVTLDIVSDYTSLIAYPSDNFEISNAIKNSLSSGKIFINQANIRNYSRQFLTDRLVDIFDKL